jgi:transcriptional regulator with XRE-family HTH domain
MTFADKVRRMRDEMGWTETQLAEVTGIPYGTLHNHLQGIRTPSFAAVAAIARAFGETCDVFADCSDLQLTRRVKKKPAGKRRGRSRKEPS